MPHSCTQIIREEHSAVAAMLRSLKMMIANGPGDQPERFFDVLRAMLFYIDEFPEKRHHPKESDLLFPRIARAVPALMPVIRKLEADHMRGEGKVRELQHLLLAWELVGDSRRPIFEDAAEKYAAFYLEHMRVEETQLLPGAEEALTSKEWKELDLAFEQDRDPLAGGVRDPVYDRLFTRIVMAAPAPIGVGPELHA
ncbi:hemerythrin domain-containing protein [Caenimonas aquaedulcis]|uniref:Hemerythrin domain-containing protein n=1 Tax=Caenimonas aquaedulcis TaxID=2793270 RepID=A0A931H7P6_9BURK|nr:hemerythrin domain-containing protein [Caenimonas aquaedulcis]MBG9390216.1 hemerythrin domain-containing protein [Caenimonas aquaedulcis]